MNYYSFVENIIGHEITESNAKWMVKIGNAELVKVRDKYSEMAWSKFSNHLSSAHTTTASNIISKENYTEFIEVPKPYNCPARLPYEHVPLIHGAYHKDADFFGGNGGTAFNHKQQEKDDDIRLNKLKFYLLYSHRVVIPDPMFYLCQFFTSTNNIYLKEGKYRLVSFLDFLYKIKELVTKEIILFYPQYEHTGVGFNSQLFINEDYTSWLETRSEKLDIRLLPSSYTPKEAPYYFEGMQQQLSQLLFMNSRYNSSLMFDNLIYETLLKEYLVFAKCSGDIKQLKGRGLEKDRGVIQKLANLNLASLSNLPISDIATVRTNSEAFESWRNSLADGINKIETSDDLDFVKKELEASLSISRQILEKEISDSSVLSSAKSSMSTFGIGVFAILTAGSPKTGIATGAAAASYHVLKDLFLERKNRKVKNSMLNHYSIITD